MLIYDNDDYQDTHAYMQIRKRPPFLKICFCLAIHKYLYYIFNSIMASNEIETDS